jgi:hypothetical protein
MRLRLSSAILCALTLSAGLAHSQAPAAPAAGQTPRVIPAPKNIKALPKDISGAEVGKLMHQYTGDLGVGCDFCHTAAGPDGRRDRASDANPMKDTARFMITMTADLNTHLDTMPGKMYADPVTCGTCHRGEKHPSVFVPAPPAAAPRPATPPPPPR